MIVYFMQNFQETGEEEAAEFDTTVTRTITGSRGVGRKGMGKIYIMTSFIICIFLQILFG